MQFAIIGLDGTDKDAPARRQAARADHIAMGEKLLASHNLWYGAALLNDDDSMKGSLYVVSFTSEKELHEWLDKEPYVIGDVWQDITIHKSNTRDPWQYSHSQEWFEENIAVGEKITADTRLDDIPVLKKINAVLVKVPNIQEGLGFYQEQLGLQTFWKKEDIASVHLGDGQLVMSTKLDPETSILVESVEHAAEVFVKASGKVVSPPEDIDVGRLVVVADPFGSELTLVDFSKGFYTVDGAKHVTGVSKDL